MRHTRALPDKGRVNLGTATPVHETAKALLVKLDSDEKEHWIPKAVIDDDSECYSMASGPGDLIVYSRFAEQESLEGDEV